VKNFKVYFIINGTPMNEIVQSNTPDNARKIVVANHKPLLAIVKKVKLVRN